MSDSEQNDQLQIYKLQLEAINSLIEETGSSSELLSAKRDLEDLVELSEESILASAKAKLLSEVDQLASSSQEETSTNVLEDLTGSLCHVVIRSTRSGRIIRHAVMILGLESDESIHTDDASKILVKVMFLHPTELWMIPCEHYLRQRCTFNERCKYSHGYSVHLPNLLEYEEPDRSLLNEGSKCLARRRVEDSKLQDSSLWQEAEIISISNNIYVVQFPGIGLDAPAILDSLDTEDVIPLPLCEEDELSEVDVLENPVEYEEPVPAQKESSELSTDWEAHTKGIGSKLLAKMGWQGPGVGVGKKGQGLAEPVPVEVMPKGMSLDSFVRLRNQSGLITLGKGAIKMLKGKAASEMIKKEKKQGQINEMSAAPTAEEKFFSFLNRSVQAKRSFEFDDVPNIKKPRESSDSKIQKASDKEIGVALVQISEKIRKLEAEIRKMHESLDRLQKRSETVEAERLKRRISEANSQLAALKQQEKQTMNQRSTQRDRKKLAVF